MFFFVSNAPKQFNYLLNSWPNILDEFLSMINLYYGISMKLWICYTHHDQDGLNKFWSLKWKFFLEYNKHLKSLLVFEIPSATAPICGNWLPLP